MANFKDLAHGWGREKGFHTVLSSSICERRGEVERKRRSDQGQSKTEDQKRNFKIKLAQTKKKAKTTMDQHHPTQEFVPAAPMTMVTNNDDDDEEEAQYGAIQQQPQEQYDVPEEEAGRTGYGMAANTTWSTTDGNSNSNMGICQPVGGTTNYVAVTETTEGLIAEQEDEQDDGMTNGGHHQDGEEPTMTTEIYQQQQQDNCGTTTAEASEVVVVGGEATVHGTNTATTENHQHLTG